MEPLFRLILLRPAVAQEPDSPNVTLGQESQLQSSLAEAAKTERPRPAMLRAARAFAAGPDFINHPRHTPLADQLADFARLLDRLERKENVRHADVVAAVSEAFGSKPANLVENDTLGTAIRRLRDSIVAIKQLPEEHGRPIEALTNLLRDLELINRTASDPGFPAAATDLRRYRRRSLELPLTLLLSSVLSTSKSDDKRQQEFAKAEASRAKAAEDLIERYRRLNGAVADLNSLDGEHYVSTPQTEFRESALPVGLTPTGVLSGQLDYFRRLSELNLKQLEAAIKGPARVDPLEVQDTAGASSAASLAWQVLKNRPPFRTGKAAFRPVGLSEVGFRLNTSGVRTLSEGTRRLLEERKVVLAETPVMRIAESLQLEINSTITQIQGLLEPPLERSFKRIGETLVRIATPVPSAWTNLSIGHVPIPPITPVPAEPRIPATFRNVAPGGIADLLIVRQQLVGYEGADVAHIENVLKGERKVRKHTLRRETEEITFLETETTNTLERELESTNRFEMTRESNVAIQENASLKAGLTLSGSYGPTVDFAASAEGSTSRSREEATRTAAEFSQEITERSSSKITERVLQRASLRVTNEVTEKNVHSLNNVDGAGNISGVYQWVNKIYEAQMFNYGVRLMFDFMTPEPAAFLIEALTTAHASAVEIQKPPDFKVQPNQINELNYGYWVQVYQVTDAAPPPEVFRTKAIDFKAGGGDDSTNYNHSGQVTIDDGYRAVQGCVSVLWNQWEDNYSIDLALGRRVQRVSGSAPSWVWVPDLDGERDTIPFALDTWNVSQVAVAVEVLCKRTDRAMEKWRLETHAKLTTAYRARLSEYEDKLAALHAQTGIPIRGKNPQANLDMMKDELKKHCISILTDQHFDLFDSIDTSATNGLPQIDVDEAEAEGAYVRFFEQAFEWENMTWLTYPYFWGRKSRWNERLAFEDPDPLFNQFLKAGFCRVSLPARRGFESAIDHFMHYGELWQGGPLPTVSSPLYLALADELAERLGRPGTEEPQGDPWLVRIPTNLVRLRSDDKLPSWEQDADGNWTEQ